MDILKTSIKSLHKEEIINYKLYTNRTQSDIKRKDIILFDLIRKDNHIKSESDFINHIYGTSTDKNKYYRLKNRLHTELCNSLVQFHYYKTDVNAVYSELMLFNIFVSKNEWEIANYHLEKAEKKAIQTNDLTLLDLIYNEKIKFASNYNFGDIKLIVEKSEEHFKKIEHLKKLEFAIAKSIYDLHKAQGYTNTEKSSLLTLKKIIKNLEKIKAFKTDIIFRTKCFEGLGRVLLSQQNYTELERFSLTVFNNFDKERLFSKSNHETKLQMLTYICNSLFINKKYELAIDWIHKLKEAMSEFNNLLYDRYIFFYYNSLVNNYSMIDPKKSMEILIKAKVEKSIMMHPTHLGYVYLNLAGAHFDLKEYRLALKNILELYHHKLFNMLDQGFKLKISILEIILRIELHDLDYAERLIKQLQLNYKESLKTEEHLSDLNFIKTIKQLIIKHQFQKNKLTREIVETFLEGNHSTKTHQIVNYAHWLATKFNLTE
ncbi:MAG: hypothetical protein HY062_15860 [Bacteroidetes bacterium]|nr:hypothetical protein [Bacteroidota bacterium]